ncbi:MAG: FHA domain-containing protein [Akkermansia sp.]|nr:FHA domain-containing protein [Akkermansia sp.]
MIMYQKMEAPREQQEEHLVADLAGRIQRMEAELEVARAQLIGMHSRLLFARQSFYADSQTEATLRSTPSMARSRQALQQEAEQQQISIEALPIQHPLRRKWSLGKVLLHRLPEADAPRLCFIGNHIPKGKLRLFGLLEDGSVWEQLIPFDRLATEGGVTLGRDATACDLCLPENGVSRSHARIELGATGLVITDLNSTNGIHLNDRHINAYSPQEPLADGCIIRFGETALRVEIVYGSAEPTPTQTPS